MKRITTTIILIAGLAAGVQAATPSAEEAAFKPVPLKPFSLRIGPARPKTAGEFFKHVPSVNPIAVDEPDLFEGKANFNGATVPEGFKEWQQKN